MSSKESSGAASVIAQLGQQALQAASAAANEDPHENTPNDQHVRVHEAPIEDVPPPPYDAEQYGRLHISQNGMDTGARVARDGRVEIKIKEKSRRLTDILTPMLRKQYCAPKPEAEPEIPDGLGYDAQGLPPPPMNLVIQIVGSRGDVQPFVALGKVLKEKFNHRVRLATHPTFRDFVHENGLEFFSIGGDPAELMAFMVKNPGLMPGIESLRAGDIGKRRKGIYEIIIGCWRSCIEAGEGTGIAASDEMLETQSLDSAISMGDPTSKPFVADAIIANPPSFAHIHVAEKLGIPVHLMFTMPWSPTQAFPHPLANILASNTDQNFANFISYSLVDMLTWQGLGDVINKFRKFTLHLEPLSIIWAPGMLSRLRIPYTYCWSPALIPKPADWGRHIDISGFYFLDLALNYQPAQDLADFLAAGEPPVYIGFGSIVVDDPNAMTKMIFEAVKKTGQRALVSKGWGGLGADELGIPEGVFMLGNCPHDWLFKKVSCVVHHGGAGTTAAGIAAGRPTVVVPFFGDQPFWGAMVARAGAGPKPIAYKDLDADKLAESILTALKPESLERAAELSNKIKQETGTATGADSFHKQLDINKLRCSLCPGRVAVWRVRRTDIRLSALAATVLGNEGLLDFGDLKLYRPCEYEVAQGPPEPISGGASALIGTLSELGAGVADVPAEILKSLKFGEYKKKEQISPADSAVSSGAATPAATNSTETTDPLSLTASQSSNSKGKAPAQPQNAEASTYGQDSTYGSDAHSVASPSATSPSVASPNGEPAANSMASVFSSDGSVRRRSSFRLGRSSSRASSRAGSRAATPDGGARGRSPCSATEAGQITLDSIIGAGKAGGKIVGVGLKSPMDFTLALAQGFHNAPKLYGDTTVRPTERVTDLQSGLKAAGKEFGYGFYDGITGLVTQPIRGARKEGGAGFFKGLVRGGLGVVLKPGAAIWGLQGYTFKGIHMEIIKHFGSSTRNYIIAARTAQGYEDWKNSSAGERERIVATWKSNKLETRKGQQKFGHDRQKEIESHILTPTKSRNHEELVHGFKNTKHLSWDERKELDRRRQALKKEEKERNKQGKDKKHEPIRTASIASTTPTVSGADLVLGAQAARTTSASTGSGQSSHDQLFEEAVQRSVAQTSRGNPQEDEVIERALRASLNALRNHPDPITDDNEDEAYQRAVQASVAEAQRVRQEQSAARDGSDITSPVQELHDADLERVLTLSLAEHQQRSRRGPLSDASSGEDTETDEDFKRAVEASKAAHDERQKRGTAGVAPPDLPPRDAVAPVSGSSTGQELHDDEDEQLRKALAASMQDNQQSQGNDDEDLTRAMTISEEENKQREAELKKQMTEEEIVMNYVKNQSLMEEQYRKAREGGSSTNEKTT